MHSEKLAAEIIELKAKKRAIIMAHYYQVDEVQEIADYTGDSYELSRLAADTDAEVIVFCGVHFMAESAAILSPDKTVLLPDPQSGCPLADMITAEGLLEMKEKYPQAAVVCYVNSSAQIKALSDICCTSANAVSIVNSLQHKQVLFVPDQNLAAYVALKTDKEIIAWPGHCITHHHITADHVKKARALHPDAAITVHPECRPEVIALSDHVGSTSGILRFAAETDFQKIIIGTEKGVLYSLQKENPDKEFHLLSQDLICPNMKLINLEKIKISLETMQPRITVPAEIGRAAGKVLERMLKVSNEVAKNDSQVPN